MHKGFTPKRAARIKMALWLHNLGLRLTAIAALMDLPLGTITNDSPHFASFGGISDTRPKNPADVFRTVLRAYAELDQLLERTRTQDQMMALLSQWLDISGIIDGLVGAEMAHDLLTHPGGAIPESYRRLIDMLKTRQYEAEYTPAANKDGVSIDSPAYYQNADEVWNWFLLDVLKRPTSAIPCSISDLEVELIRHYIAGWRADIAPLWGAETVTVIDQALETLPPRLARVIRCRCGIGYEQPMTLRQIGNLEGVGQERIRQIEAKAIRLLSHPSRGLAQLMLPVGNTLEAQLRRNRIQKSVEHQLVSLPKSPLLNRLLMPCRKLNLSVRAANALRNRDLQYVGDFISFSERELLQVKNMGHKSLLEIKAALAEFGLVLGMEIGPDLSAAFAAYRTAGVEPPVAVIQATSENLFRRIDELDLSVRAQNCCRNAGICYVGELVQKQPDQLLRSKNFGLKTLVEIKEVLAEMGLSFGMTLPDDINEQIRELGDI